MRKSVFPQTSAGPRRIVLSENSFWSAYGRSREIEIDCREGEVWITQEGDSRDVILHAGQQFRSEGRGLLVVQAMTGASILVNDGTSGRRRDS